MELVATDFDNSDHKGDDNNTLLPSSPSSSTNNGEVDLNEVLDSIPVGVFHYRLLLICGLSFMADAMEVSLLSFLSPCVSADWNLSDAETASITSVVFAGILVGSVFWGPLADTRGRRRAFIYGSSMIIIGGFLSAFCPDYATFIICRAVVGFGVGGISVPFDLLAEYLPNEYRGKFLMYIEYFWTIGSMFVAGSAWIILSQGGDWRALTLVTAAPVTIGLAVSICYLPESPRYLIEQGRLDEAAQALRAVAEVNGHPWKPVTLKATPGSLHSHSSMGAIRQLLQSDQIRVTVAVWIVWLSFGFSYYGLILFVARVFEHNEEADDLNGDEETCDFEYNEIFVSAASEVVGVTLTAVVIDRWGRVGTQSFMYACAGISTILMGINLPSAARLSMSIMARSTAMGAASATWVANPELYPTESRATAHAIANSISHLGGFLCPYLIDSSAVTNGAIGAILGSVSLLAAVVVLATPETLGKNL